MQYAVRFLVVALVLSAAPAVAQQQEETVPLQVPVSQLDALEKLLRKQPIEDFGVLYFTLSQQRNQYLQTKIGTMQNDLERRVRDKLAAEAAAAAEKKAADNPPAPPAPSEEPKQ